MNKRELIEVIAAKRSCPLSTAEKYIDSIFETVATTVQKGDDVRLVGFGTFTKSKRKARMGRNPQTGQSIKIPSKWYPKFRAGGNFKASVRG